MSLIDYLLGTEQAVIPPPIRSGPAPFGVGDKVQAMVTVEELKAMQQGHGGWNQRMAEVNNLFESVLNFFLYY